MGGGQIAEEKPAAPPTDETNNPHKTDGKTTIDPTLGAPRPVAPLSVTWVNTDKPKFHWALGTGITGGVVEVSDTRDFKEVRYRWSNMGADLVAADALKPGIWFWRLKGRTLETEGLTPGPVWEVLVRGPSANQVASVAPMGSVLDMNGDGLPDLAMTYEAMPYVPNEPNELGGVTFLGHADGTFTVDENSGVGFFVENLDVGLTGGIDLDGDGYGDLAVSELVQWEAPPAAREAGIFIFHGGAKGYDDEKDADEDLGYVRAPSSSVAASIQALGDVNGDGYGDLAVQNPNLGFAALGSAKGSSSMMVFADDEDPKLPGLALASAIDYNVDGFSDIVMASSIASSPFRFARGSRDRFEALTTLTLSTPKIPSRATAITSGDFDGNGVIDIAFATVIDNTPAVCMYTPNTGALGVDSCWMGTGTADDAATSLAAGDFNGDGTDEIIVASKSGITTLKRNGDHFDATPIPGSFGTRVTMIHPGRGGGVWSDARWAVLGADGLSFHIFKNTTSVQQLQIKGHKFLLKLGPSIR
jgi:hypothetical protein